jgi:putative ABC transport system substrate-binding protein
MRRRDFIAGIGGAAMGWRCPARAEGVRPRVAILQLVGRPPVDVFTGALAELGYIDGKTIDIDYRNAGGDGARILPLAREIAALKPDVALAGGPNAARALKSAAPDLPIVCPQLIQDMPDLFESFSHPGGSVTGIAMVVEGMNAKLVELAAELMPETKRIGFLENPTDAIFAQSIVQVASAARARGLAFEIARASAKDEIAPALDRLAQDGPLPVIVASNGLFGQEAAVIAERALTDHLPTIFNYPTILVGPREAGGLVGYGIDNFASNRRAAVFVAKIVKGERPADIPIEFPTKVLLVINLKTAKALGLTIPPTILVRADEVIE